MKLAITTFIFDMGLGVVGTSVLCAVWSFFCVLFVFFDFLGFPKGINTRTVGRTLSRVFMSRIGQGPFYRFRDC